MIQLPENNLYGKLAELQRRLAVYEEESAYKEIFFMLFSSLTRFSLSIVHSRELAEEIVSDIFFIQLWNNRKEAEAIEDLRLYLFIAVKNNSVRKLKQQRKNTPVSIDDLSIELDSFYLNPEQQLLSGETLHSIERAIEQLPPRARLIFKLAKEDKMRYKEIASLLNISVKTVDHQLAIALKKIAAAIGMLIRKKS
ncbi:MAG: RNA polymerase sigma-70 factor [Chitinophagaceae bacterium]|nr:RNA polymerase sigma-70 factor [Chitinophagaceae bacterium]